MRRVKFLGLAVLLLAACGEQGEQLAPGGSGGSGGAGGSGGGALCGNGVVEAGESCDDGNDVDGDACTSGCEVARCGDGFVHEGAEACDDGNDVDTDGCTSTCALPACGDGHVQGDEACDHGVANSDTAADACRSDCTAARCGDGVRDTGEACDDANEDEDDECTSLCQPPRCGDGFLQGDEACDDGEANSDQAPDACRTDCATPACGDGVADSGEACDDGNDDETDGCTTLCAAPRCGDGILHEGEACDDGAGNSNSRADACRLNCTAPSCGDGVADSGEACDDGNDDDSDLCLRSCTLARCGDGILRSTEECDDGNNLDGDTCDSACLLTFCGNGSVDTPLQGTVTVVTPVVTNPNGATGHVCHDGASCSGPCNLYVDRDPQAPEHGICQALGHRRAVSVVWGSGVGADDEVMPQAANWSCDGYACEASDDADTTDDCDAGEMLDTIVCERMPFVEACDDANTDPYDACTPGCTATYCGDGVVHNGVETCDDGNTVGGDGCSATCMREGRSLPAPGQRLTLTGSLDANDAVWERPYEDCSRSWITGMHYELHEFTNDTAAELLLIFTAEWAPGTDGYLHIVDPPFNPVPPIYNCLAGDDDYGASGSQIFAYTVPAGSSITVVASDGAPGGQIGAYTLRIFAIGALEMDGNEAAAEAMPIALDEIVTGMILNGDKDYFAFQATAGATYSIETWSGAPESCAVGNGSSADTRIRLYDTDGVTELATDDNGGLASACSLLTWTAPSTGTYYFRTQYTDDSDVWESIIPYFVEVRSP
ncbi:DUF4215 domain-containing protein [Vulgatibacter sp.]|uniref:DUF4215 domain-containing protein n=1 Tax=Vulgatibacter sp. TaxID=1971226 RepID=UPI0035681EF6